MCAGSMMTSRERVATTLARREPDRVPVDYGGNAGIDTRLRVALGVDSMAAVRERLGCDMMHMLPEYNGPPLHPDDPSGARKVDPVWGIHRRWIEHGSGGYWDYCDFPLAEADLAVARAWPMPDPDDFDYDAACASIAAAGDRAVILGHAGTGDVINNSGMLFSMEQVLIRLIDDDPALGHIIERRNHIQATVIERMLERAGPRIDAVMIGEDLGTQLGPIISHELFRAQVAPRLQRIIDIAVRYGKPVIMHSCGASHHFFDELAAMGVTCMQTLQPEAAGMQPRRLKRDFGDRLAFMGGLSTAGVLAKGDVEAVRAEVRELLAAYMPGGGYIFGPTHSVQDDTPAENVIAAFDEAHRSGVYA